MYTKVTIDNFRCFEHLEVGPLARVNLITGANNVGKTALLEALLLLTNPSEPPLATAVNEWRGLVAEPGDAGTHLAALFTGSTPGSAAVVEAETGSDATEKLTLRISDVSHESGTGITSHSPVDQPGDVALYRLDVGLAGGREAGYQVWIHGDGTLVYAAPRYRGPLRSQLLLPFQRPSMADDVQRLSRAELAGRAGNVVRIAQCAEQRRITRLVILQRGEASIHVELEPGGLVPVQLMGQGFGRLLSLALVMTDVPSGVLLVDEIENGIYHKAMPDVWRGLAHAAREFDVQLFATTHSYECVQAAVEAFRDEFAGDLHLHRLDRLKDGSITATTYDAEAVHDAVELNWEVR